MLEVTTVQAIGTFCGCEICVHDVYMHNDIMYMFNAFGANKLKSFVDAVTKIRVRQEFIHQ